MMEKKKALTEFDIFDMIDKPIWDNVWKEWLILYRHPDYYRDLYLQRVNNYSYEFIFVEGRYFANQVD